MTSERKRRMEELLARRRYSAALEAIADQLGGLGLTLGRDDALAADAVQEALETVRQRDSCHLIFHRVWGVMLRSEAMATMKHLPSRLEDERAALIWGTTPPVGFVVDVPLALRALSDQVGPEPGELGAVGPPYDILLVADEGESGLRFEYNHYAQADEYELRSWGRYALCLVE